MFPGLPGGTASVCEAPISFSYAVKTSQSTGETTKIETLLLIKTFIEKISDLQEKVSQVSTDTTKHVFKSDAATLLGDRASAGGTSVGER